MPGSLIRVLLLEDDDDPIVIGDLLLNDRRSRYEVDWARSRCDRAAAEGDRIAGYVHRPIREVVSGRWSSFAIQYPCHSSTSSAGSICGSRGA